MNIDTGMTLYISTAKYQRPDHSIGLTFPDRVASPRTESCSEMAQLRTLGYPRS